MVHPRLYWGDVGNDLTQPLIEIPISRNYHHGGWSPRQAFFDSAHSPVSAGRIYDIFNENGWGRSLHFLNAWILVIVGLVYLLFALSTGHVRGNLLPRRREMTLRTFFGDLADHIRRRTRYVKGPHYGILQKISYCVVLFFLVPTVVLTGLTMSPAISASYPWLPKLFFGVQSARTIHFFCAVALVVFLFVHVVMVMRTGFRKHLRAMTIEA